MRTCSGVLVGEVNDSILGCCHPGLWRISSHVYFPKCCWSVCQALFLETVKLSFTPSVFLDPFRICTHRTAFCLMIVRYMSEGRGALGQLPATRRPPSREEVAREKAQIIRLEAQIADVDRELRSTASMPELGDTSAFPLFIYFHRSQYIFQSIFLLCQSTRNQPSVVLTPPGTKCSPHFLQQFVLGAVSTTLSDPPAPASSPAVPAAPVSSTVAPAFSLRAALEAARMEAEDRHVLIPTLDPQDPPPVVPAPRGTPDTGWVGVGRTSPTVIKKKPGREPPSTPTATAPRPGGRAAPGDDDWVYKCRMK